MWFEASRFLKFTLNFCTILITRTSWMRATSRWSRSWLILLSSQFWGGPGTTTLLLIIFTLRKNLMNRHSKWFAFSSYVKLIWTFSNILIGNLTFFLFCLLSFFIFLALHYIIGIYKVEYVSLFSELLEPRAVKL